MPGSATTPSPASSRTLTADSPATVIIARHGLRIDFVDPDWRLTAERPHDSPMTQSGRVMGWRMGVHLWARLRALHPSPLPTRSSVSGNDGADGTTGDVERRAAEVAALLDRVVVLASPLMRAVDTAAHVCQGLEDAAAEELAAYADPRTSTTDDAWDHRSRLPATLSHPEGHPMVIGGAARAEALSRRIPIHVEPAMTETTYWMCRDMCKKYRRSYLEAADEVPHPIVLPAEVLKRSVSDRVIAPLAMQEDPSAGMQRAVLCPVHYQFDPKRGTVVEALQPMERFSRAWVHLLAPQRYAADATSGVSSWTPTQAAPGHPAPHQSMSAIGHAARTPFVPRDDGTPAHIAKPDEPSPYRDKIVLLLGHGQTVAGMAQTLPHVLHGHFAVPAAHVPRVTPTEAPLAGFAMFHRRPVVETDQDAHTYDTIVDAFSEEHLGSAE